MHRICHVLYRGCVDLVNVVIHKELGDIFPNNQEGGRFALPVQSAGPVWPDRHAGVAGGHFSCKARTQNQRIAHLSLSSALPPRESRVHSQWQMEHRPE